MAVRIAFAESGMRTEAVGDSGNSLGLFQIHVPAHKSKINCDLFEPECNIRLAKQIRDSSSWLAWSVWKNNTF